MRFKSTGITLSYEALGPDNSTTPPILFIHGYPLSRKIWLPQMDALSEYTRVLAIDLRGFGDSEASTGPYSLDLFADDCITLLDQLNITIPVIVCGLSMGGYITFALYRKYPQRVRGLILSSTRA